MVSPRAAGAGLVASQFIATTVRYQLDVVEVISQLRSTQHLLSVGYLARYWGRQYHQMTLSGRQWKVLQQG